METLETPLLPPTTENIDRLSHIDIEGLYLTEQDQALVQEAVAERNAGFSEEISFIDQATALHAGLGQHRTITGATQELSAVVNQKLDAYLQTDAGRRDSEIARLRYLTQAPAELDEAVKTGMAQELRISTGGLARVLSGGKRRAENKLVKAAHNRLAEILVPGEGIVADAYGGALEITPTISPRSMPDAMSAEQPTRGEELVAFLQEQSDHLSKDQQRVIAAWQQDEGSDSLQKVLKGLARGEVSTDDIIGYLQQQKADEADNKNVRGVRAVAIEALGQLEQDTVDYTFAEASLTGLVFGQEELDLVNTYQESVNLLLMSLDEDPRIYQFSKRIEENVARKQQEFKDRRVDSPRRQYWHFTARTLDLANDPNRSLASGAFDEIANTTDGHSKGIHFVSPGDWLRPDYKSQEYLNYAYAPQGLQGGNRANQLGCAVVFPLGALTEVTPLRNEGKIVTGDDQHRAPDATFRTADGSPYYEYSLKKAYVVPFYSEDQVPAPEADPLTGEYDYSKPVRDCFRDAGYPEWWIEGHIIDFPDAVLEEPNVKKRQLRMVQYAQADIAHRLEADMGNSAGAIVPLRSERGMWETLDHKGDPGFEPEVERLVTVGRAA